MPLKLDVPHHREVFQGVIVCKLSGFLVITTLHFLKLEMSADMGDSCEWIKIITVDKGCFCSFVVGLGAQQSLKMSQKALDLGSIVWHVWGNDKCVQNCSQKI